MGKVGIWIGGIFTPVGLLFASVGGWFYWDDQKLAEIGQRSQGTVIELSRSRDSDGDVSYRPIVEFFDDNGTRHEFESSLGSSPPSHARGDIVDVIYDPDAPSDAIIDGFMDRYFLPLMFVGMGSLFAAIGAGMLFAYWRRRKIIAQLRRSGVPIEAEFIECYRDTSTKVNGRSPYRVVAQTTHPATGKLESFKSDPIWLDLTRQLAGEKVRVFVDPARPKHHFVDLSEYVDSDDMA